MGLDELEVLTRKLVARGTTTRTSDLILVVEDDEADAKVLTDILRLMNYRVYTSSSYQDVLCIVREDRPFLALLDYKLPQYTGLELARKIKAISPGTACIILTAYATIDTAIKAVNAGLHGYLIKPYDQIVLLDMIANLK